MRDKVLGPRFVQNAFDSSAEATSCEAWTVWVRHMKRSSSKVTDISIGSFLHDSPCTVFPGKALKKYVLLQTTAGMECIFAQTVNFVNMDRRQLLVVPIKSWKTKSLKPYILYTLWYLCDKMISAQVITSGLWTPDQIHSQHPLGRGQRSLTRSQWTGGDRSTKFMSYTRDQLRAEAEVSTSPPTVDHRTVQQHAL